MRKLSTHILELSREPLRTVNNVSICSLNWDSDKAIEFISLTSRQFSRKTGEVAEEKFPVMMTRVCLGQLKKSHHIEQEKHNNNNICNKNASRISVSFLPPLSQVSLDILRS